MNESARRWEHFDKLMISTGAVPLKPPVEGIESRGVFGVDTLQSGLELIRHIEEVRPEKVVVIGGGYI